MEEVAFELIYERSQLVIGQYSFPEGGAETTAVHCKLQNSIDHQKANYVAKTKKKRKYPHSTN